MNKIKAIKLVSEAAKRYKENLMNQNYLFITSENRVMETLFNKHNFKHLTGVESALDPNSFFDRAISNKLKKSDITIKEDGTTALKLDALFVLMDIKNFSSLIGDYSPSLSNITLKTDVLIGKNIYCMGFVMDEKSKRYVPNTALKEDIKKLTDIREKINCVFKKSKKDPLYKEVYFLRKGIQIKDLVLPQEIHRQIDPDTLNQFKKI